jgi:hypothetical protein
MRWWTRSVLLPACDIGGVFDNFVRRAYGLRLLFPKGHLVMRTVDVTDAFRSKPVDPEHAPMFAYVWKGFLIVDLRMQFGYTGAPGHFQRHSGMYDRRRTITLGGRISVSMDT